MNLVELKGRLDTYVKFAKQYPAVYRPVIVSHLLAQEPRDGRHAAAPVEVARPIAAEQEGPATVTAPTITEASATIDVPQIVQQRALDADSAWVSMARDLGVPEASVRRAIQYDASGRPVIRLRFDEGSTARKQLAYAFAYLYGAEHAGGGSANSKELRELCVEKRVFDSANFTRNFKAKPQWLEVYGNPGRRDQDWCLTEAGRAEARAILRRALGAGAQGDEAQVAIPNEPTPFANVAAD